MDVQFATTTANMVSESLHVGDAGDVMDAAAQILA
jgi:hypothetical protein